MDKDTVNYPLLLCLAGALVLSGATPGAWSADCVVDAPTNTQCVLASPGDSATVTATGSVSITATTGNPSHVIHSNLSSQITLGSISIEGNVSTVGVGTNNGYIVNLVKANAPISSLPGGIFLNANAEGNSRGIYINDHDVGGITIGSAGLLSTASLAIHVVDSSVITGNVTNGGTIRSNGGTVYLGNASVNPRVTGAFTNAGTIYGPGYALVTESGITGGATNSASAAIIGVVNMPLVSFTNDGELANKANSSIETPASVGDPASSSVGNFTQGAGGLLRMAASGTTTAGTDFSRLTANGDAQVAGSLHVDVKAGFTATTGTVIPGVLKATGSLTGNFSSVLDNSATYDFEAVVNGSDIDLRISVNGFVIGGTVTGLDDGETVVLQNNAGNDLTIGSNTSFQFPIPVEEGGDYDVTVLTHPSGKSCKVLNDDGSATADVTNVEVICEVTPYIEVSGGSCYVDIPATELSLVGSDARSAPFLPIDNKLAFAVECDPGATATIRATFGQDLPVTPGAYKLVAGVWTEIPNATFDGNVLIYQITDNDGVFDQDETPGRIEDPVSVVSRDDPQSFSPIPVLPSLALMLLALLSTGLAMQQFSVRQRVSS